MTREQERRFAHLALHPDYMPVVYRQLDLEIVAHTVADAPLRYYEFPSVRRLDDGNVVVIPNVHREAAICAAIAGLMVGAFTRLATVGEDP